MLDIDENTVRLRAYEIWEADGRPEGNELQHWERAVQDLTAATAFARPAKKARARNTGTSMAARPRRKTAKATS